MDFQILDDRSKVLRTTVEELSSQDNLTCGPDSEDCCVICLERVSEKAQAIPCQHKSFDYICLLSWLEQRTTCPLCNAEVISVYYDITGDIKYKVYNVVKSRENGPADHHFLTRDAHPGRQARRRTIQPCIPHYHRTPDEALLRRRYVYRQKLFSLHVGSNHISRFRDLNPQLFRNDPQLISRARKWIRRELRVFEFLSPDALGSSNLNSTRRANNAEYLLEYIIAILKTVDTQGSGGQAEEMLQGFIGRENTRLFLHELRSWLRSPHTSLEDWDRAVQYAMPSKHLNTTTSSQEQQSEDFNFTIRRVAKAYKGMNFEQSSRYKPYHIGRQQAREHIRRRHMPD